MKILIGILCVIVCTIIGKMLSEKFQKRKDFFSELNNLNQRLKSEITFKQSILKDIVDNLNNETLKSYLVERVFNKNDGINVVFLTNDENDFLNDYASNLGVFDKNSQLSFLTSVDAQIQTYYKTSREEEQKYRKLYIKLGFLFGLIIMVVVL